MLATQHNNLNEIVSITDLSRSSGVPYPTLILRDKKLGLKKVGKKYEITPFQKTKLLDLKGLRNKEVVRNIPITLDDGEEFSLEVVRDNRPELDELDKNLDQAEEREFKEIEKEGRVNLTREMIRQASLFMDEYKEAMASPEDIPAEVYLLNKQLGGAFFLTVQETAQFMRLSTKTILRAIQSGNLRSYEFGNKHRIPLKSLVDFLNIRDTFYE